jgi:hypothetical protein
MNDTERQTAWAESKEGLSPTQLTKLTAAMSETLREEVRKVLPPAIESALREYGYSNEVLGLLHVLAAKSNDRYEDLLRKALTLYNVALDASDNGNRMAILNPEDVIVREIVGVDPSDHTVQPLAH